MATGLGVDEEFALTGKGAPDPRGGTRLIPLTMSECIILFSGAISDDGALAAPGSGGKELASMVKLSAATGVWELKFVRLPAFLSLWFLFVVS